MIRVLSCALAAALLLAGLQTYRLTAEERDHAVTRELHQTKLTELETEALEAEKKARTEEQRRVSALQRIADEAEENLVRARADAVAAGASGQRLRDRIAQLTASCSQPTGKAATAHPGAAARTTADLLARVQQRLDEAADGIAEFADRSHSSGLACQRSYEALN